MPEVSAGLLVYRPGTERGGSTEVLLVHPGGPHWENKDDRAWTIPKSEVNEGKIFQLQPFANSARRPDSRRAGHLLPSAQLSKKRSPIRHPGRNIYGVLHPGQ
jgi:predicted NUDIX family NTP pyrophosphohydrolase